MNTKFEAYKISRVIKREGTEVEFFRNTRNAYGEQTDEAESIGTLAGLYHETNGRIEVDRGGVSVWRTVQLPYVTATLDDIKALELKVDDWCIVGHRRHTVGGIVDVQQWGIIGTVTLEVLDNGK